MSETDPQIAYNESLADLSRLLQSVKRPGEYFAAGTLETAMP